jgi:S1-C subfamily serine protease
VWIDVARADRMRFNGYWLPRLGEGMGVVMPSGQIATAAHVVWGARAITITDIKGVKLAARIACINKDVDVALLHVEQPLLPGAPVRAKPAVSGERVAVVEPRRASEPPHVIYGAIGATKWTSHGVPVPLIFSGIKGEKGMSGGGLFDASGQLVGIVIRVDRTLGYLSALPVTEAASRCAIGSR